jgi:hypothetical protein
MDYTCVFSIAVLPHAAVRKSTVFPQQNIIRHK